MSRGKKMVEMALTALNEKKEEGLLCELELQENGLPYSVGIKQKENCQDFMVSGLQVFDNNVGNNTQPLQKDVTFDVVHTIEPIDESFAVNYAGVLPNDARKDVLMAESELDDADSDFIPGTPQHVSPSSESDEPMAQDEDFSVRMNRKTSKLCRMEGKDYHGYQRVKETGKVLHGKRRNARKMKSRCNSEVCKISKSCFLIKEEDRCTVFSNFWKMTWDQKRVYINNAVNNVRPKRRTVGDESRRTATLQYHLMIKGTKHRVCKKMFLATFGLGEWMVRKMVEEQNGYGTAVSGQERIKRRKSSCQSDRARAHLRTFLASLPRLPSHYCRKYSKKLYFEGFTNFSEFYREYTKDCDEQKIDKLSQTTVNDELKKQNVAIFQPRKDQCDLCTEYKVGNIEKSVWEQHCNEKDFVRQMMEEDVTQAKQGKQIVLFMDLQAVKLCPAVKASALYYKTKLCVHNFTVCDVKNMDTMCYWFDESEGDLTASTFASCLIDYITSVKEEAPLPIIIYSDGCTYQNRNAIMANALLHLSVDLGLKITQKYLIKGHTQMVVDSVHATIERALKGKDIYLPSDYLKITTVARKKVPYRVKLLDHKFFKDYTQDMVYESIRPGRISKVVDIRQIIYNENDILVKVSDTDCMSLPRRQKQPPTKKFAFPPLHRGRLRITETKFKHLQELKSIMPKDCWPYFDQLPHGKKKRVT